MSFLRSKPRTPTIATLNSYKAFASTFHHTGTYPLLIIPSISLLIRIGLEIVLLSALGGRRHVYDQQPPVGRFAVLLLATVLLVILHLLTWCHEPSSTVHLSSNNNQPRFTYIRRSELHHGTSTARCSIWRECPQSPQHRRGQEPESTNFPDINLPKVCLSTLVICL